MLLEWALGNLWFAILFWMLLYVSDYILTIVGARLRAARSRHRVATEGSYELNTYFVSDVDKQRLVSVRFLFALTWSTLLIALIWFLSHADRSLLVFFELAFGGVILLELTIHMRHVRNIFSFHRQTHAGEMDGGVRFSRRYVYWVSALDLVLFASLYLILYLLIGRVFFVGGALSCGVLAIRHRLRMRREPLLTAPQAQVGK